MQTASAFSRTLAAIRDLLVQGMMQVRNEGLQETCPIGIIDFEKW